ncbi:MAG: 16S rRNA (adenine(1518)-N(6)/adenine(1519)-N(6))-dimethyltransferase RsmA [Saprospiraceae bacterium]
MRAKKSFGQHFLHREDIAERIANALTLTDLYNDIIEIGPGQGMLTKYLLERPEGIVSIEADRDMVMYMMTHYPLLNVIHKDFLRAELDKIMPRPFALIGNFPYNISSQILIKMVENRHQIPEMVGMFQKEVAERVVAPPGNKTYGVIGVLVQAFYEGEVLFNVGRGAFNPPPKVESAVIRLVRKDLDTIDYSYKLFRQVVKTSFGQRRKMLRNTLKPFFQGDHVEILQEPFFKQRPERVSVEEFINLTKRISAIRAISEEK